MQIETIIIEFIKWLGCDITDVKHIPIFQNISIIHFWRFKTPIFILYIDF